MAAITKVPANVKLGGKGSSKPEEIQVGEAVTAGDVLYLNGNLWMIGDATTAAKANVSRIAMSDAAANGYVIAALPGMVIDFGATLVKGVTYILGPAAGAGDVHAEDEYGSMASGTFKTSIGVAIDTSSVKFAPNASGIAKA